MADIQGDIERNDSSKRMVAAPSFRDLSMRMSKVDIDAAANPFTPRKGRTLSWSNVNMTLSAKGKDDRKLLDNMWGTVPSKEITAIMGPSGSGKTSLLNILAGRSRSYGKIKIDSVVKLDDNIINPRNISIRKKIAFVSQEESLQPTDTPREAIIFSARLRLPRTTSDREIKALSDVMIEELGLDDCADTIIGGGLIKGISGGQKKRTSVGVELVVKPSMVFLDEPTSGLDSFSAVQLVQVLHKVADSGASVLFTIHQPPSEIFNSLDHLILLTKGRIMYSGSVKDIPSHFAACNNPMPDRFNPADWIMQVAQVNTMKQLESDGFFPKEPKQDKVFNPARSQSINEVVHTASFATQTSLQFKREMKVFTRAKIGLVFRFGITAFISILTGAIFLGVGNTDPSIPLNLSSHFGALTVTLMSVMMGTAQPSMVQFALDRPIFLREYSTNHYSVTSYFISKFFIEAVLVALQTLLTAVISYFMMDFTMNFWILFLVTYAIALSSASVAVLLGSAAENAKVAQELLPILLVPQMLFSGFFVGTELIPIWLRWCQYICFFTYSIRLAIIYEFSNCEGAAFFACEALKEGLGVNNEDQIWVYWLLLIVIFLVCRLFGLFILQRKATKFH